MVAFVLFGSNINKLTWRMKLQYLKGVAFILSACYSFNRICALSSSRRKHSFAQQYTRDKIFHMRSWSVNLRESDPTIRTTEGFHTHASLLRNQKYILLVFSCI